MTNKGLHPSIENFKVFVKNNPRVMEEVRSGKVTLQELYEEWFLLGEEDTKWDDFRSEKKEDGKSNEANADWMKTGSRNSEKHGSKSNATLSWAFKSGDWSHSRSCRSVSKWICPKKCEF